MRFRHSAKAGGPNRTSANPRCSRKGLTLLEVVISTAVFLAAASVILNLIRIGTTASATGRLQTEAAFRAETVMSEVLSEVRPMDSVDEMPFEDDDDGGWRFSVTRESADTSDLLRLTVRAWYQVDDRAVASVTLERLARDPLIWEQAAAAAAEAEDEEE